MCLLSLLDLSAAFDTIDHSILLSRMEITFGIKGSALAWFESYLKFRTQSVKIGSSFSEDNTLQFVSGLSAWSNFIYYVYSTIVFSFENAFYSKNYHFYADDQQLYRSFLREFLNKLISITENCIQDVKGWMTTNKLKFNDTKTEFILFKNLWSLKEDLVAQLNINSNLIV